VIGVIPGQIVTEALRSEPTVARRRSRRRPARDLAKLAVFERHLGTGRVGSGLVRGFGLQRGALAIDDRARRPQPRRRRRRGRGHAASAVGGSPRSAAGSSPSTVRSSAELPLPIAGLISERALEQGSPPRAPATPPRTALGCTLDSPFQTMAFLALSVIPHLKLTDRGPRRRGRFELVDLWV
jgi:adenine deaminase